MQFRGLLAAVAVLAVLAVGIWISNKNEEKKAKQPEESKDKPKIVAVAEDQIQQIDLKRADSVITLKKTDKWRITAPESFGVDDDVMNSMISTLAAINATRIVDEKPADVSEFGLTPPRLVVTIAKKDGKTTKLLVGTSSPGDTGAYVQVEGDPKLYLIASSDKTSLDKSVGDLRDKRLVTFDSDKLTRVELTSKGQTIEFGRNQQNEWQLVKPKPLRADNWAVEELVRKIREAKMDPNVPEADAKKIAADAASGSVVATAKLTDAAGTHVMEVRKKGNDFFAKGSSVNTFYKVANDLGEGLDKGLDDFRNKKLFDFAFNDPTRIDIKTAAGAKSYQKQGEKWMSDGKEMDSVSVQSFVDRIRDLSAIKFVDAGYRSPIFEVSIVAREGKLKEHVLIGKEGDSYFAIRENEPAVYELDGKAFEDLQRVAGDIKPPAPPKKEDEKKK